jgi:hypothetical protein
MYIDKLNFILGCQVYHRVCLLAGLPVGRFACWPVCLLANEQGHLSKPINGLTESLQVEKASIQPKSQAISAPMSRFALSDPEAHFVFTQFF